MKKTSSILLLAAALLLDSCAPLPVYYSTDARTRASSHKVIAIAPPKVELTTLKKLAPDTLMELQKKESEHLQSMTVGWLKLWKKEGRMLVDIQDADQTNTRLKMAGYFDGRQMSLNDICDSLGVDAVILSDYVLTSTTLKEGELIFIQLMGGSSLMPDNAATTTIEIHDKATNKIIWNCHYHTSASVAISTTELVDNILRKASMRMPYYLK